MKIDNITDHFKYNKNEFVRDTVIDSSHMLCFLLNLMPGQVVPQHRHGDSEGSAYIVKGSMLFTIGEKEVCMAEGDIISFNGSEMIGAKNNTGINASCMVTLCPNPGNGRDIQEIGFQSGEPYNNV